MHRSKLLAVASAAVLCSTCGLGELNDRAPAPTNTPAWRTGADGPDGHLRLNIERITAQGNVSARADGVRLVLADGTRHELPFAAGAIDGETLRLRCADLVADHAVRVAVVQERDAVRIEVEDTVELPSELAELSLAIELLAPGAVADETFLPQELVGDDEVAGDRMWRTPLAFLRSGPLAMALLPDVTTPRARVLPAALEAHRQSGHLGLRHGLVAQRVVATKDSVVCRRDASMSRRVAGQTLTFALDLRLWPDAQPQHTLTAAARDVWQQLAAPVSAQASAPLSPVVDRVLAARAFLTEDRAATGQSIPFGARENALLLADALSTLADPSALADARRLLQLALSAPMRSGLSPDRVQIVRGRSTWHHSDAPGHSMTGNAPVYDATAVAWTRVCGLHVARRLPATDELRAAAERAALETARFLRANQRANGSIPALYETVYLAPLTKVLSEPAAEAGAAALLLAECASLKTDDARALSDAAVAVVLYLAREVHPERAWHDRATVDAERMRGRGTLGLTMAALAALQLSESVDHAGLHDATVAFLDALALQQQVWSPLWLAPDPGRARLIGGFGRHDGDPTWSDPAQALTALAFLRGYDHLGRRDLLQRGACALRAALADQSLSDDAVVDACSVTGMAAAVSQLVWTRWGQVVVDIADGSAEALDAVQASRVEVSDEEIRLLARSPFELVSRTRASFRGPLPKERYTLVVNDQPLKRHTVAELIAGVPITPLPVPAFTVAPPRSIQDNQPFRPRVRFAAAPPPGFQGTVYLTTKPLEDQWHSRLVQTADPRTWQAIEPVDPQNWPGVGKIRSSPLPRGAQLRMRVELIGEQQQQVIAVADEAIEIAHDTTIDVAGRDDTDCASGEACPRVLFVDGARLARQVGDAEHALLWMSTVPVGALSLELEVWLAGAVRLFANDSVVHEDLADTADVPRTVRVKISDRRLWEDNRLTLKFVSAAPAGAPVQIAEVRTHIVVDAGTPADADTAVDPEIQPFAVLSRPDRARSPDAQFAVLIVPAALADVPLTLSKDQLETVFFGENYRRTPEPQSRPTSGSVREVLLAVSGGRTMLVGEVAEPLSSAFTAGELGSPLNSKQLAQLVTPVCEAFNRRFDAVLLVHSGPAAALTAADPAGPATTQARGLPPIVLVADRANDRSTLPVGEALAALLSARYDLARRSSPASGNFGALALTGHTDDHLPATPIGVDLAAAGWADVVDVIGASGEIAAAAMQHERRVHRIASGLPGRGDLFLEVRGGVAEEPSLPQSGLLAYWRLPQPLLVRNVQGAVEYPSVLRLARGVGVTDSPFVPGSASDLVRRAAVLDDVSSPALGTAQGELCCVLRSVGPAAISGASTLGERIGFNFEKLTHRLFDSLRDAQVDVGGGRWMPIPRDGVNRGLGAVKLDQQLTITAHQQAVRALFAAPSVAGRGQRVFANAQLAGGGARIRIGYADVTVLQATFAAGEAPLGMCLDLPPVADAHTLFLEVVPDGVPTCTLTVGDFTSVPRVRADHAPLRALKSQTARLSDGCTHAPLLPLTTGRDSRAEIHEPVLIPTQRTMLRLRCGFAADDAAATRATIDVRLSTLDGKTTYRLLDAHTIQRGAGTQPLLTALLAIPEIDKAFVGAMTITINAEPDTTLWLATAEVARP